MKNQFRTQALRSAPERVDRANNVIRGIKVIDMGEINDDRPFFVSEDTLADVVKFGNQRNKGTKVRFTHPNMCSDGMGNYLGRAKNFRVDGESTLADLYIADAAFDSPNGDLGSYVMELAEDDPEAFGVSIVAHFADEMVEAMSEAEDGELVEMRLQGLRAADIVDEPAATRGGLFDITTPQGLPEAVRWLFDHHFSEVEPREIERKFFEFMGSYFEGYKPMADDQKIDLDGSDELHEEDFAEEQTVEEQPETDAQLEEQAEVVDLGEGQRYVDAFGDRGARWFLEGKSFEDCLLSELSEERARSQKLADMLKESQDQLSQFNDGEAELSGSVDNAGEVAKQAELREKMKLGISERDARWAQAFK